MVKVGDLYSYSLYNRGTQLFEYAGYRRNHKKMDRISQYWFVPLSDSEVIDFKIDVQFSIEVF